MAAKRQADRLHSRRPTSGSPSSLWNFFTRICDDALLCDTTSSPAAPPPAAVPAASFPARLLLSPLVAEAALPASPEPCSCSWPTPASTASCCWACGGGGLCTAAAAGASGSQCCYKCGNTAQRGSVLPSWTSDWAAGTTGAGVASSGCGAATDVTFHLTSPPAHPALPLEEGPSAAGPNCSDAVLDRGVYCPAEPWSDTS